MNLKYSYLLVLILFLSNCTHKISVDEISSNNIEEKIDKAFLDAELYDKTGEIIPVLFFIDKNNVTFTDSCVLSKVYHLRALKNYTLKESDTLLKNVKLGLKVAENCDDIVLHTVLNNLLGIYYNEKRNYQSAIHFFNQAIFYGTKNKDKKFVLDTHFNIITAHAKLKNWQDVIGYAKKGIAIIKRGNANKKRLKYLYTYLAEAYINLGNYTLAEEYLSKSIEITKKLNEITDKEDILKSYRIIYLMYAELNKQQNNYDLAYKFLKTSDSLMLLKIGQETVRNNLFLDREQKLESKLLKSTKEVIRYHRIITIGSLLFLLISSYFIRKSHKDSNQLKTILKEKKELNNKLLDSLSKLEVTHEGLVSRNKEINSLLKFNEETLLSKTLKISNYKDAVNNIIKNINKLIEEKESIKSVKMHAVNRALQQIISEQDMWNDFKIQFEKNRPNFFNNLLNRNSELTITEQKHCAYVAVNLKSKEVATILNLSPRSVETTRYRLKKKLNLENESLQEYLKKI